MKNPTAAQRLLLALAAYVAALLACWLVTGAKPLEPDEIFLLVAMFPFGLPPVAELIDWLTPRKVAPAMIAPFFYPALIVALAFIQNVRAFRWAYGIFVVLLVVNVGGCAVLRSGF
jgi:hypothetical protein